MTPPLSIFGFLNSSFTDNQHFEVIGDKTLGADLTGGAAIGELPPKESRLVPTGRPVSD
jgi:hypothetical protein